MSNVGQSRHYAEARYEPPPRRVTPWKYSPPSKASEYHLIDLFAGVSQGGFETLIGRSAKRPREALVGVGYLPWQCSGRVPRTAMRQSVGGTLIAPRPAPAVAAQYEGDGGRPTRGSPCSPNGSR